MPSKDTQFVFSKHPALQKIVEDRAESVFGKNWREEVKPGRVRMELQLRFRLINSICRGDISLCYGEGNAGDFLVDTRKGEILVDIPDRVPARSLFSAPDGRPVAQEHHQNWNIGTPTSASEDDPSEIAFWETGTMKWIKYNRQDHNSAGMTGKISTVEF